MNAPCAESGRQYQDWLPSKGGCDWRELSVTVDLCWCHSGLPSVMQMDRGVNTGQIVHRAWKRLPSHRGSCQLGSVGIAITLTFSAYLARWSLKLDDLIIEDKEIRLQIRIITHGPFYWHAVASRQAACDTWATHQPRCILRVWGRGGRGENETESTVKGAKAGEAQSWQRAGEEGGRGNLPRLPVSAYQSGGTTSQWLLSCPYYAKTCILGGARLRVESHARTERFSTG